ncbi:MAG: outer membrane protein transport protein, partial [Calditrichaeota bacterium]|nr:outer membrane protein transport protein [Calditrichota bacterium]
MEVRHTDLFFDEALLSAVVQYKRLHLSTFREVIYDARLSFQSLQTIEVDPALPVETVIQRNFPSRKTLLKTRIVDNGLSLAWGFSERLNFGASLRLTRLEYHLNEEQYYENEFPGPALQYRGLNHITADNLYLLQSIDEKRWGIGFSAGMISHLSERLMVGLVYNYRPAFDLKSNIFLPRYSVSRGDSLITFASREDTTTRVRYDLPDAYGIGIAYKYRGRLNIALDLVRVRYSELLSPAEKSRSGRDPRNLIQDDLPGGIDPE